MKNILIWLSALVILGIVCNTMMDEPNLQEKKVVRDQTVYFATLKAKLISSIHESIDKADLDPVQKQDLKTRALSEYIHAGRPAFWSFMNYQYKNKYSTISGPIVYIGHSLLPDSLKERARDYNENNSSFPFIIMGDKMLKFHLYPKDSTINLTHYKIGEIIKCKTVYKGMACFDYCEILD